jgi:hypothetical protein
MSCYQVSHVGCILIRVSTTLSDMNGGLFTVSKCSNSTFIIVTLVIWG